jgi:hypothetical protein
MGQEPPRRRTYRLHDLAGPGVVPAGPKCHLLIDDEVVRRLLAHSRPHVKALAVGTLLALLAGAAGLVQPLPAKAVVDGG